MIDEYLKSWESFRLACEKKAKDRCVINSDGWRKLKQFHLETYLSKNENPYFFLLTVKWKHRDIFNKDRMARYYYRHARQRTEGLNPDFSDIISYPSWRNNAYSK
jgi:hypothetical protein